MSFLFVLGLLSYSGASPVTSDVLVVDIGGPAGSFRTIQEAVDAAQDGDTVFVAAPETNGLHVDGFILDGKGLQIVAHVGAVNRIRRSIVRNVPGGSEVLLQGLAFQCVTSHAMPLRPDASRAWDAGAQGPGLTVENCSGPVALATCGAASADAAGILVTDCQLVTMRSVYAVGGSRTPPQPGFGGLEVYRSRVDVQRSSLEGGFGQGGSCTGGFGCTSCTQGGDGGVGAEFGQGTEAFVSDTEFMGGSGGQCGNCWPCDGFQGLGAIGTGGGQAQTRGCRFNGSPWGSGTAGPIHGHLDEGRDLFVPGSVGPDGTLTMEISGAPGEVVYFLMSNRGGIHAIGADGRPLMTGAPLLGGRRRLGTLDASGKMRLDAVLAPALATGTQVRHLQIAFLSPGGVRFSDAHTVLHVGADAPLLAATEPIHVVPGATNHGVGRAWNEPHADLDRALTHSLVDADLQTHYWLLAGQYTADELGEPHPSGGNFRLLIGASLHGGFDGSETSIEERDLTVNRTVLSGDVLGDDLPNYSNRADNLSRLFYSNTYSELRDVTLTQLDGIDFVHFGGPSGVGNGGTAILLEAQHRALIQDCRFSENWAGSSLVVASSLEVARTEWTGNRGLLMNQNGYGLASLCIENSSFLANVAKYRLVVGEGWAPMELVNLTVVANRVYQPTWSLFMQDEVMGGASMSVQNCIFWRNASGGSTSEAVHFSANALAATPPDIGWSCIDQWTGTTASTGVIAVDPRFVDAVGPDGIPFSGDEDLRLAPASPCIDAGNNDPILPAGTELDLARSARRVDSPTVLDTGNGTAPIVDMGALERR